MLASLAAVAAASVPGIGCAQQALPPPPPPTADRWVIAGPAAWAGVRPRHVGRRGDSVFRKAGLSVNAGRIVTLRVLSPRAGLVYRHEIAGAERWQDADRVLRVRPCAGTPRTGFAGLLMAHGRKCVHVRVTRGGRSWVARLPVGRRCA